MNNYENEVFTFGERTNNGSEQANNLNLESISGLGASNYENDNIFADENKDTLKPIPVTNDNVDVNFPINQQEPENKVVLDPIPEKIDNVQENSNQVSNNEEFNPFVQTGGEINSIVQKMQIEDPTNLGEISNSVVSTETNNLIDNKEILEPIEQNKEEAVDIFDFNLPNEITKVDESTEETEEENTIEDTKEQLPSDSTLTPIKNEEIVDTNNKEVIDKDQEIFLSDTSLEELENLTKYEEEKIESTDINSLFDKVSINVQDASDIFKKNTDMKAKIDNKFNELKKLQSELETAKQKQLDEINAYKSEVLSKLTDKKSEIEKRLNTLKDYQSNLEKEKAEFEKYKKEELDNIEKVQKEVQDAYDNRREELSTIEDSLRKQKDSLDEERNQLSLDRIQYEADKNELANNLLKFNELVNSFTNGVNSAGRE